MFCYCFELLNVEREEASMPGRKQFDLPRNNEGET